MAELLAFEVWLLAPPEVIHQSLLAMLRGFAIGTLVGLAVAYWHRPRDDE
jgi:ABC-type nitrate/sulfonate/bicarbonate transport system permease component